MCVCVCVCACVCLSHIPTHQNQSIAKSQKSAEVPDCIVLVSHADFLALLLSALNNRNPSGAHCNPDFDVSLSLSRSLARSLARARARALSLSRPPSSLALSLHYFSLRNRTSDMPP